MIQIFYVLWITVFLLLRPLFNKSNKNLPWSQYPTQRCPINPHPSWLWNLLVILVGFWLKSMIEQVRWPYSPWYVVRNNKLNKSLTMQMKPNIFYHNEKFEMNTRPYTIPLRKIGTSCIEILRSNWRENKFWRIKTYHFKRIHGIRELDAHVDHHPFLLNIEVVTSEVSHDVPKEIWIIRIEYQNSPIIIQKRLAKR
jgi:hypothetical protein